MEEIRVVFIGGLSNGKIIYDYLIRNKFVDLSLTITYPDDYSGARHTVIPSNNSIFKSTSTIDAVKRIREASPDLIIVAGWSEIISKEILGIPRLGTIGFHPSRLPLDRGRSVLAWQIEDGYEETALSMFYYSDYPDGGDIIAQEKIIIDNNDYISDVLDKVDEATYNLIIAYFPLIRKGLAERCKQDLSEGNFRRLRKERDSIINWNTNSKFIYNKVRAISQPYPGAIGLVRGENIKIWKVSILNDFIFGKEVLPGTIVAELYDASIIVKTKDSFIHIQEWEKI